MRPPTWFSGSAFSMRSNLVGGRFTQNGPPNRKFHFFGTFGPFGAPGACEIPPDAQESSKSRIALQEAKPSKLKNVRSCAVRTRFRWAKRNRKHPWWHRVTTETAPCRKHMVQPGVELGTCRKYMVQPGYEPGTSPSLGGGPPQTTSKSPIAGKTVERHPTSST